ncbi:glycosyltransferase [Flavobacterium sp. DG2-3]|uniref:glycosyltransferase n=1 Tax=Flavobacterium sp. DG2-3 TaxID=3068317 RepID=UPI00273F990D|nr:glycosyltransferase [Flavobacterium sp. DG2-3]MDP5200683.1 glycosyltransferase [Flavobacterium sp. DG2-3]
MDSLVSVVIPCFNVSKFVEETIESVISQTYQNWEIIIVDDGSNDDLFETIDKYLSDSRISFFRKENGGLSSARNFGISKSKGIYILPLDADDLIHPTYIEKAVNVFNNDDELKLVYCRVSYFGEKEGEWILPPYSFPEILIENMIFSASMFKKNDFISVGKYNETLKSGLEDWDLWIRLLCPDGKVFKIPEILFFYRKHAGTSMSDKFLDKEKHNIVLNTLFDINRNIYNDYFGNPIFMARKAILFKKKIVSIENSIVFRFYNKLKKIKNSKWFIFK